MKMVRMEFHPVIRETLGRLITDDVGTPGGIVVILGGDVRYSCLAIIPLG